MPGPKTEQTWNDTKKFWKNAGVAKLIKTGFESAGNALSGGMVGAAAENLQNAPKRRDLQADGTNSEPGQSGSSVEAYNNRQRSEDL